MDTTMNTTPLETLMMMMEVPLLWHGECDASCSNICLWKKAWAPNDVSNPTSERRANLVPWAFRGYIESDIELFGTACMHCLTWLENYPYERDTIPCIKRSISEFLCCHWSVWILSTCLPDGYLGEEAWMEYVVEFMLGYGEGEYGVSNFQCSVCTKVHDGRRSNHFYSCFLKLESSKLVNRWKTSWCIRSHGYMSWISNNFVWYYKKMDDFQVIFQKSYYISIVISIFDHAFINHSIPFIIVRWSGWVFTKSLTIQHFYRVLGFVVVNLGNGFFHSL